MNDINRLKESQREKHPGFSNYLGRRKTFCSFEVKQFLKTLFCSLQSAVQGHCLRD